jgi:hypothetical protein
VTVEREVTRLRQRLELLDRLERYRFEPTLVPAFLGAGDTPPLDRADALQAQLETENLAVYESIRAAIRRDAGRFDLLAWLRHAPHDTIDALDDGYDHRDEILAGVLQLAEPEATRVAPTAEMVFYQPTPARHVVELIQRTRLDSDDVLVDLGSGLGHVPIVASMCTGARSIGVEIEPAYVACARRAAESLKVERVTFVEADATTVSLDEGTVFHLYTPFGGGMLRAVLDALRAQACLREIRVSALGPCVRTVAAEAWLQCDGDVRPDRISVFRSRPLC